MTEPTRQGLLILGPTGSGKTPLGNHLERRGWADRACRHFDFGERLRSVATGRISGFTQDEVAFIREVLDRGRLLENESFYLAESILRSFIEADGTDPGATIVLNGLPRHAGQAEAIGAIVKVDTVICLECTPRVAVERLHRDSGDDRSGRTDDGFALVEDKLRIYEERTAPLVALYSGRGAAIHSLQVGVSTQPADLLTRMVEERNPTGHNSPGRLRSRA